MSCWTKIFMLRFLILDWQRSAQTKPVVTSPLEYWGHKDMLAQSENFSRKRLILLPAQVKCLFIGCFAFHRFKVTFSCRYALTGHLTTKSDVYSYGVVLLELLTGRVPVDIKRAPGEASLVSWVSFLTISICL